MAAIAAVLVTLGGVLDHLARRRRPQHAASAAVESSTGSGQPVDRDDAGQPAEAHTENRSAAVKPPAPTRLDSSDPQQNGDLQWATRPRSMPVVLHSPPATAVSVAAGSGDPRTAADAGMGLPGASRDVQLAADLAAWHAADCRRPHLTLLGPVHARTSGKALSRRRPYYTELLAFLTLRPGGATPPEVAEAFGITTARVRTDIKVVRDWLGTDPGTGTRYLPDARDTAAAQTRGLPVYQVQGVLCDWRLFERLQDEAARHPAPQAAALRQQALQLVTGRPFDQLRIQGWNWLLDGDRVDQQAVVSIVDAAHRLTTHYISTGDHEAARRAARVAATAAPEEHGPRQDLDASANAASRHATKVSQPRQPTAHATRKTQT